MLIIPANTLASGGFEVANSLRFNDGSSDYLNQTVGGGSRTTWTWSAWIKLGSLATDRSLFSTYVHGNDNFKINIADTDTVSMRFYNGTEFQLGLNRVFRDTAAWYHLVFVADTTNATAADRFRIYVNGVRETSFQSGANSQPTRNLAMSVNDSNVQQIGRFNTGAYFDGYMAEVRFIDGQALAADSFGEFDEDSEIWKPIDVSGLTSGTNGYYLEFKGSGTSANSSGLGADTGGNTEHFTVNNLTAVDQSIDTCTNNYCVMNPLDNFFSNATFSQGNLQYSSSRYASPTSTFGVTKGKWYFEIKCVSAAGTGGFVGITSATATATNFEFGNTGGGRAGYVYANNGGVYGNGGTLAGAGVFAEFGDDDNDLLMMAADLDNNKIYFGKNGTWGNSQNPVNGNNALTIVAISTQDSGVWRFGAMGETNNATVWQWNFGSPVHSIDSTQADDDGHGNFEYDVPAGYFALNSKNLAEYG